MFAAARCDAWRLSGQPISACLLFALITRYDGAFLGLMRRGAPLYFLLLDAINHLMVSLGKGVLSVCSLVRTPGERPYHTATLSMPPLNQKPCQNIYWTRCIQLVTGI